MNPPLTLKRVGRTSWLGDGMRWSIEARVTSNGMRFFVQDLQNAWKSPPLSTLNAAIEALETRSVRIVRQAGATRRDSSLPR